MDHDEAKALAPDVLAAWILDTAARGGRWTFAAGRHPAGHDGCFLEFVPGGPLSAAGQALLRGLGFRPSGSSATATWGRWVDPAAARVVAAQLVAGASEAS